MWCAFVPACSSRCSVSRAAEATARKNSSAASCSKPAMSPAGSRSKPSQAQYGRPGDVDRAGGARLVHRDHGVPVARDAAALAERAVQRLAEHDPGVLDRVVRARLQVALHARLEVQPAVAREQVEHVVKEADAGRAGARPVAVQRQLQGDARLPRPAFDLRAALAHARGFSRISIDAAWCSEALGTRDRRSGARERGSGAADAHLGHPPPEVPGGQPGGEARGAPGRQRVVGAGHVVAERRAGLPAHEQAARPAHARRQGLRRSARELEVLGRERLAEGQCGRHVGGEHLRGRAAERVQQRGVVADGDHERVLAVLGLGEQVQPQRLRVGALGEDHREVARAREAVDADVARHLALGLLHPQAARPDDHVGGRHRLRAVGERGDRLRAAHPEHGVDPAQRAGGEDRGIVPAGHDDLVDARGPGRHRAHDDRGRVRVAPGRDVDRGPRDGHLAQPHRVALRELGRGLGVEPGLGDEAHVLRRDLQPFANGRIEVLERRGELLGRDAQRAATPEALLVLEQSAVAARAHGGDDPTHDLGHRLPAADAEADLRRQRRGRLGGAATPCHGSGRSRRRSPPP